MKLRLFEPPEEAAEYASVSSLARALVKRVRDWWLLILIGIAVIAVLIGVGLIIPQAEDKGPSREEREHNEFCQTFPESCVPADAGETPVP